MSIAEASRRVAGELRRMLLEYYGEAYYSTVIGEGVSGDETRRIDIAAEEYAVDLFRGSGLNLWVVSEERGVYRLREKPDYIILLDPLDGSLNYAMQIPFSSISIVAYNASETIPLIHEAVYGIVQSVFSDVRVEYVDGKALLNGRVFEKRVERRRIPVVSAYLNNTGELEALRRALADPAGGLKLRIMGSASLEASLSSLGLIDYFVSLTGRLRNIDVALAIALAVKLDSGILVYPPLEELRVDDVKVIRKLIIGPREGMPLSLGEGFQGGQLSY
ncbi:MAG: inositol-1-monophosphatase [Desulfurococcus sp.]|nr:inositol-1-monophosphatase [Desulfurococcus sp.]